MDPHLLHSRWVPSLLAISTALVCLFSGRSPPLSLATVAAPSDLPQLGSITPQVVGLPWPEMPPAGVRTVASELLSQSSAHPVQSPKAPDQRWLIRSLLLEEIDHQQLPLRAADLWSLIPSPSGRVRLLSKCSTSTSPSLTEPLYPQWEAPMLVRNSLPESLPLFSSEREDAGSPSYGLLQPTLLQDAFPSTTASLLKVQLPPASPALSLDFTPRLAVPLYKRNSWLQEDLPSLEWSDLLFLETHAMPHPDIAGATLFCIVVRPQLALPERNFQQTFHFFIDRTQSIDPPHRNSFQQAVVKALRALDEKQTFTVTLLDKKSRVLSAKPLPCSQKSFLLAEEFLEKELFQHRTSSGDVYAALSDAFPASPIDSSHLETAILISDGFPHCSERDQRRTMRTLLKQNKGKIPLYTAAAGPRNDLFHLTLLARLHGGDLLHSDTYAAFARKLARLVLSLQAPVATELQVSCLPHDAAGTVSLLVPSQVSAPLYRERPIYLWGMTTKTDRLTLFLQGNHAGKAFQASKEINLLEAIPMSNAFQKRWVAWEGFQHYEKFLEDGKAPDLTLAQKLLQAHTSAASRSSRI